MGSTSEVFSYQFRPGVLLCCVVGRRSFSDELRVLIWTDFSYFQVHCGGPLWPILRRDDLGGD